jgi:hypothetical protein
MDEALYDGLAHEAVFYVPIAGIVQFAFSDPSTSAYVSSRDGSWLRIHSDNRLFLSAGEHVLMLYEPKFAGRVSIALVPSYA